RQPVGVIVARQQFIVAAGLEVDAQGRVAAGYARVHREARHVVENLTGVQLRDARVDGVVAGLQLQLTAKTLALGQDVIHVDGAGDHGAAHRAVDVALDVRALDHLDTADQVGVDVAAVGGAVVTAPDRHRLFGA